MKVLIPYRWGVLLVDLKYDRAEQRWRGSINTKPVPMAFTTKHFTKIAQAARWSWASWKDGKM